MRRDAPCGAVPCPAHGWADASVNGDSACQEAYRNRGIGARLIKAFGYLARGAGVRGMHIITGADMRNVGFYRRCGFVEQGRVARGARTLVFLGRDLRGPPVGG